MVTFTFQWNIKNENFGIKYSKTSRKLSNTKNCPHLSVVRSSILNGKNIT